MKKRYGIAIGVAVVVILVVAGLFGRSRYAAYKKEKEAAKHAKYEQQMNQKVTSYADKTYGDKWVLDTELADMTAEQITPLLKEAMQKYSERKVTITVDGEAQSYSMKDCKEKIRYVCSDGTRFRAGEEKQLAEKLIAMDKDLSVIDQYAILKKEAKPSTEKITIECKSTSKGLKAVRSALQAKYVIPVTNAHMKANGKITGTKNGQTLDLDTIQKELKKYLNSDTQQDYQASYETSVVEPRWYPKDLKKINTVISKFETTFVHTSDRGHNIQVGASRVNGICLLPGETTSFDERIHDNSDGQSFRKANSYLKGQVVQTDGGGICQISTTAYNAILRAGILPEKRYPHSMPVHYVPLGLDAAISEGVKDLKITNTLDVPIMIYGKTKGNRLIFEVKSYKNALKGYQYKPRAVQLSSVSAKAYLDVYKGKKKVKSILLHTDRYQQHS